MMKGHDMCWVHKLAWLLAIIGALNWGIIGLADYNVLEVVFGGAPVLLQIVYVLIGLSGIAILPFVHHACKACKVKGRRMK